MPRKKKIKVPRPGAVIVLGMHRSGTSLVASMLSDLGVDFGERLMPAAEDNSQGFFEDIDVVNLHEEFLASIGSAWDDPTPLLPSRYPNMRRLQNELADNLVRVVGEKFAGTAPWGLKDPRICRLSQVWNEVLKRLSVKPAFVVPFRHPLECIDSLARRDDMPGGRAAYLWLEHVLGAERWTRHKVRALCDVDTLRSSAGAELARVGARIGLEVPADGEQEPSKSSGRVRPDLLRKTRKTPAALKGAPILELCLETYNLLKGDDTAATHAGLDEIAAKLETHQSWAPGLTDRLAGDRRRLARESNELKISLDAEVARTGELNSSHSRKDVVIDELRARLDAVQGVRTTLEADAAANERIKGDLSADIREERARFFDLANRMAHEIGIEPPSASAELEAEAVSTLIERVRNRFKELKAGEADGAQQTAKLERELNLVSDAVACLLAGDGGSRFRGLSVKTDAARRLTEMLEPLLTLQQRYKQVQAEVEDTIRERDAALATVDKLQSELSRMEQAAEDRETEASKAIESVTSDLEAARDALSEADQRAQTAARQSETIGEDLAKARDQISALEAESGKRLAALKEELEAAEGRGRQTRDEADALRKERDEISALKAEAEQREAEANKRLDSLKEELEAADGRGQQARSEADALRKERDATSERLEDLRTEHDDTRKSLERLREDAARREAEAAAQSAKAQQAIDLLKAEHSSAVSRLAASTDELTRWRAKAEQLKSKVTAAAQARDSYRRSAEELNRELEVERTGRNEALDRIETLTADVRERASEHDAVVAELTHERRIREEARDRATMMRAELDREIVQREDAQKKALALKQKLSLAADELRLQTGSLSNRDAEIEALRQQIDMIRRSRSWRAGSPWRVLANQARRLRAVLKRPNAAPQSEPEQAASEERRDTLRVSIDNLNRKDDRVHLHGWAVDETHRLATVDLNLIDGIGRSLRIPGDYGTSRKDVANALDRPDFELSGFWVSGTLPEHVRDAWLTFRYTDGAHITVPLHQADLGALVTVGHRPFSSLSAMLKLSDVPKALKGVLSGDYRRIVHALERRRSSITAGEATPLERALSSSAGGEDGECDEVRKRLLDRSRSRSVIIDHALGGGANHYAREEAERRISEGGRVLRFEYAPSALTIRACMSDEDNVQFDQTLSSNMALIDTIRAFLPETVVLNNVYTFIDPSGLASELSALKKELGFRLVMPLHDFFPVCPSYNLINSEGNFCGVPKERGVCEACIASHQGEFTGYVGTRSIARWRDDWGRFLNACDEIRCFSHSSEALLLRAYPNLDRKKLRYIPHTLAYDPRKPEIAPIAGRVRIGVMGTVSIHKGRDIIVELLGLLEQADTDFEIVVIGSLSPALSHERLIVHGGYKPEELPDLIERYGLHLFLMPSIWPETFSYVTEEIMRLEMPLAVFDIGAPAERVASYSKGVILREISAEAALAGVLEIVQAQTDEQGGQVA